MKKIGVIFSYIPDEYNSSREGLNLILSASCYTDNINIFFIGDGVFQIIRNKYFLFQLSKKYIRIFNMLTLYNKNNFYVCYESLSQRGFKKDIAFSIQVQVINFINMRKKIDQCNHILKF